LSIFSATPVHEEQKSGIASITEGIASAFKGEEKKEEKKPRFSLVTADLLPRIRRGLAGEEEKKDAVLSGWKAVVRSRKEREEILRYVSLNACGKDTL
jgi:hypothetical protein